jgi:uncharacterized damage-inducible protein DinB
MRPPIPAPDGDERTQLAAWLDVQRALVHFKCEGVSDVNARRTLLPSSPRMSMASLVSHLRWVEHRWFEYGLLGEPDRSPSTDQEPRAEWMVDDVPIADLLEAYERQCARSREIVTVVDLNTMSKRPGMGDQPVSARWILLHMIEETARHVGHLDAMRELADGVTGYMYPLDR